MWLPDGIRGLLQRALFLEFQSFAPVWHSSEEHDEVPGRLRCRLRAQLHYTDPVAYLHIVAGTLWSLACDIDRSGIFVHRCTALGLRTPFGDFLIRQIISDRKGHLRMTASRAALVYAICLCLLYALVPTLTFPGPPLDVVEGFAWGRELQLGYTKHPPLQAWLLEATYRLTDGHYVGGYWLSALSTGFGYLFIWQISRKLGLSGWQAFWAIVLTSVTFYFTLPMPEFNPNILQIPIWSGMILLFLRAQQEGRLIDWLLLAVLAACGLYAKYFVALLIGTMGLYTLVFADARRLVLTIGPWLCVCVCSVLLVPHVFWLLDTDFLTIQYAASRSKPASSFLQHLFNPLNFLFCADRQPRRTVSCCLRRAWLARAQKLQL